MELFQILYMAVLVLTTGYAGLFGGRAGITGAAILWAGSLLTVAVSDTTWASTDYGVMLVDASCLGALVVLAFTSDRCWPIWATGFQIVAVLAHITTLVAPGFWPRAYYWLVGAWALPILLAMAFGTYLDRIEEMRRNR